MENVDIFNKRREKLENIRERGKLEKNEYSISVHVWLLEDDKLWIQQRSNEKKMFPGLWEQSGGGVISGETSLEAVKRETKEELGLDTFDALKYICTAPAKKIYSFNVSDESKKELQIISSLYLNKNLDKDYKFEKLF